MRVNIAVGRPHQSCEDERDGDITLKTYQLDSEKLGIFQFLEEISIHF